MTTGQLKNILANYPEDTPVLVNEEHWGCSVAIADIEEGEERFTIISRGRTPIDKGLQKVVYLMLDMYGT